MIDHIISAQSFGANLLFSVPGLSGAVSSAFASFTGAIESLSGMPWSEIEIPFWTILTGIIGNSACAIVGCYLVLRRMSMLGDAISHAVLAAIGVVFLMTGTIAYLPMFIGALVVGMLTAFMTETLHAVADVPEDSGMGVVFTSLFALGVVIISQFKLDLDVDCVLFGKFELVALLPVEILGIEVPLALVRLSIVLLITLTIVIVFWKELKIASFDPQLATAIGFNATVIHYLLMGTVASVTVASLESVGAILVIAMLIVPPATAHMLTDRMWLMMCIAVLVGALSSIFGYMGAVWLDTNTAGMVAVVAGIQFALAVTFSPRYGLVSRMYHNAKIAMRVLQEDIVSRLYRMEEQQAGTAAVSMQQCVDMVGENWGGWLAVRLMRWRGQLETADGGLLQLSASGRNTGKSLVRSHRLWESYISKHFELPKDHLHEPAHRIEHYIGPELQQQLERDLEGAEIDPHGTKIPEAD